jgi:acetyl-CoA decarbonylase/synthase complex subunit gamma
MALSAIEIYKLLPQTNCRDCGFPTCLAFAMQLAQKKTSLDKCPTASEEAKAALEGSSAPPINLVTIGAGERALKIGNETAMFRHEDAFHHPCGLAVTVPSDLDAAQLAKRAADLSALQFDRVGQSTGVDLLALQHVPGSDLAAAAREVAANGSLPIVLMTDDPVAMAAAAAAIADKRPLLYAATSANLDDMAAIAKQHNLPLAVRSDGVANLADLAQRASEAGVTEIVLDSGARTPAEMLADLTAIRRAALLKKNRQVGHPTIVVAMGDSPLSKVVNASVAIAKYAGIVVVDFDDPALLLPLVTARLNIYTDPEKPIQVQAGIYEVGTPTEDSPVLVTTNFSLTYFTVEGDVSASKVPAWILVVDTKGTSVLTAWAAEDFTAETISKALATSGIADKVKHRTVILPGGVAVLSGKLEDQSGWTVVVGPRESAGIPAFLKALPVPA